MSSNSFILTRTKQCSNCPWKVDSDPFSIDGYNPEKHANLACSIAKPCATNYTPKEIHIMACHHSEPSDEQYCIGWLHNQLGTGNNIALRLRMRNCENIGDMQVYGEQHQSFEQTLPNYKTNTL